MDLKPDESHALHSQGNETVYFEQSETLEITQSDRSKLEVEIPDGTFYGIRLEAWPACRQPL